LIKKIILCLLLISCISCDNDSGRGKKLETLSHDNGLVISVNKDVSKITKTAGGFKINLAGEGLRAINELEVKKSDSSPANLSSYAVKMIKGTDYYSKLETVSEGSGGEEYIYRIWKPSKEGGVLLEHYIQQESMPVFDDDWEIIQSSN